MTENVMMDPPRMVVACYQDIPLVLAFPETVELLVTVPCHVARVDATQLYQAQCMAVNQPSLSHILFSGKAVSPVPVHDCVLHCGFDYGVVWQIPEGRR